MDQGPRVDRSTVARLRLAAQSLIGAPGVPQAETASDVVARLTAVQCQDLPAGMLATWLRTRDADPSAVALALASGGVVRTWTMRGTLFLVPREEVRPFLHLTGARMERGAASRHRRLGISEEDVAVARNVTERVLPGRGATRSELFAAFEAAGQATREQRGVHLLAILSNRLVLVQGPLRGRHQEFRLADEWVPAGGTGPEPQDVALERLASRFLAGHGPADEADFAWWIGLPVTMLRGPFAAAARSFATVTHEGRQLWGRPEVAALAESGAGADAVNAIPMWDELVLGYKDRSAVLSTDAAALAVAGGVFKALVTVGGHAVGTWTKAGTAKAPRAELTPFGDGRDVSAGPALARVARFWSTSG